MAPSRGSMLFKPKSAGGGGEARPAKARDMASNHRRVTVKAGYSSASRGGAAGHARYLARPEAQERERGAEALVGYVGRGSANAPFFDHCRERVGREEVARSLNDGARRWHVIASPNDGARLDMRAWTRDFMDKVQNDLGCEVRWFAVVHRADNFARDGNRHVHIVFSSKSPETRRDFRIARDYVKDGFRLRSQEAAERRLGPCTEREMAQLQRQMTDNRERGAELRQLDRERTPMGERIRAGREWTREPSIMEQRSAREQEREQGRERGYEMER